MIPIEQAIKKLLIERGWGIDANAKQNASGELREFVHPRFQTKLTWLGAIYEQCMIEFDDFDEEVNKEQDIHNADNRHDDE
jgi:hypothetical protein